MKKIVIALTLIIVSAVVVNAQNDTIKPVKGDWGISLNITGLINDIKVQNNQDANGNYMIFARYYMKDHMALRLGLGVNYTKKSWFNADSISIASGNRALQEIDSTESRFDFTIAVGIEKHLGKTKRLDPYIGGDLIIGRLGNTKIDAKTDITDVTGTQNIQRIIQQDGGFVFGLGGIAGFNYFFTRNFSLGVEISYAYTFTRSGGEFSESFVDTPVSGAQTSTFVKGKSEFSQTTIGATPTGGIMLSYFF
jgi:Outer membrane protein beta-barrel domain